MPRARSAAAEKKSFPSHTKFPGQHRSLELITAKRDRLCQCRDFTSVDFSPFYLFHLFQTGQLILVELFCCVLFGLQCLFLVFVSVSSYDELNFLQDVLKFR